MMKRLGASGSLILSGASATLVGIGLGRFAYAALLPAIIEASWFSAVEGAYLGAANLAGYLVGALVAPALGRRLGGVAVIRASLVLVCLSFVLCTVPAPFAWFFLWRLLAGVAGALLMVLGPSHVLAALPPDRRKSGASLVFTGVGVGILLSATLVPVLVAWSLSLAWWALGAAAILPTVLCWRRWRHAGADAQAPADGAEGPAATPGVTLGAVLVAYALDAVGFVPHTVFWVDFLARQAGYSTAAAGGFWALFALGAVAGPFLAGRAAQVLGWNLALAAALTAKAVAVALPVYTRAPWAAVFSSVVVGALVPGMVALVSGRIAELVGPTQHRRAWGWATAVFASSQAAAAYAFAALYAEAGSYLPLFGWGAAALGLAGLLAAAAPALQSERLPAADTNRRR